MDIVIRPEEETDFIKVEELTREAFWNLYKPGCDEHYTAHKLRTSSDFIKNLDFVAENDGHIVGSIMYSKSYVENEEAQRIETATFGPLCVHPKYQRRGIGTMLIEHTKDIVIKNGYPAIIILGDPHNYCKHGFKTGKDLNISTMDGKYPSGLLVLELKKGVFNDHKWGFKVSDSYEVNMEEMELFDKKFPLKNKEYQYSQDLFSIMIRSYVE
ncbi:MAG: N-acetyltransferase [Desulfamplus sp.]|nr:N-acetyltransferase [Desulfamplus sp.]